jgi:hypothetical protein
MLKLAVRIVTSGLREVLPVPETHTSHCSHLAGRSRAVSVTKATCCATKEIFLFFCLQAACGRYLGLSRRPVAGTSDWALSSVQELRLRKRVTSHPPFLTSSHASWSTGTALPSTLRFTRRLAKFVVRLLTLLLPAQEIGNSILFNISGVSWYFSLLMV